MMEQFITDMGKTVIAVAKLNNVYGFYDGMSGIFEILKDDYTKEVEDNLKKAVEILNAIGFEFKIGFASVEDGYEYDFYYASEL